MPCEERERLESGLVEMVNRLDYLIKLRRNDPKPRLLKQKIERLSLKIHQAQRKLHTHRCEHGCFMKDASHETANPNAESRRKVRADYRFAKVPFIANATAGPST